jgi:chromosome segregation ATPase
MAEEEINTLEEERRLIRDQINDKTSELKTLRSLFSNYHVDVPRQIVEIGAKLKNPALSRKARQVLIQEQAGLRYDARQYDAGIRTREREIKELQAQLRDLDDKKKRSKEHEENTIALQRNFENNNGMNSKSKHHSQSELYLVEVFEVCCVLMQKLCTSETSCSFTIRLRPGSKRNNASSRMICVNTT